MADPKATKKIPTTARTLLRDNNDPTMTDNADHRHLQPAMSSRRHADDGGGQNPDGPTQALAHTS
jgi:hypothetical protein